MTLRLIEEGGEYQQRPIPENEACWWKLHHRTGEPSLLFLPPTEARRLKRVGRRKVRGLEKPRIHQCTVCDKVGPWTAAWGWYGSFKDIDEGKELVKVCSPACRAIAVRQRLIPIDAEETDE